jgi:hypothetical protein
MTLEEAMAISERRLDTEPREDEIAAWRASQPRPKPKRRTRGLDTAPAPEVDWATVIRQAILGEREHTAEVVGGAIGEYGNGLLDEIEATIAATAAELREEFARQIDQLRAELSGRIDSTQTHGAELKAQLDEIIARRRRTKAAKANGEHLLLPAPVLADARDALSLGNGDARP